MAFNPSRKTIRSRARHQTSRTDMDSPDQRWSGTLIDIKEFPQNRIGVILEPASSNPGVASGNQDAKARLLIRGTSEFWDLVPRHRSYSLSQIPSDHHSTLRSICFAENPVRVGVRPHRFAFVEVHYESAISDSIEPKVERCVLSEVTASFEPQTLCQLVRRNRY